MIAKTVQYKEWTIQYHVGGVKTMYIAFDKDGNKVKTSYNLAWLKKDLVS